MVESARDMQEAVDALLEGVDILVMAAAVADFRPDTAADQKIKKRPGEDTLDLHLVKNPDILAGSIRPGLLKVGFAAETEHVASTRRPSWRRRGST